MTGASGMFPSALAFNPTTPLPLQAAGQPSASSSGTARSLERPVEQSQFAPGVVSAPGAGTRTEPPTAEEPAAGAQAPLADWFRAHVAELWRFVARLGVPVHSIDDV